MASFDGATHHYDDDAPAALDAHPAGEGYDLLLCGPENDTQWLQSDTHEDLEKWR